MLLHASRLEEARNALENASTLDPLDYRTWLYLGITLNGLGRFGEARYALEKAATGTQLSLSELRRLLFSRAEGLPATNRWDEGFRFLYEALGAGGDRGDQYVGDTKALVTHVFRAG